MTAQDVSTPSPIEPKKNHRISLYRGLLLLIMASVISAPIYELYVILHRQQQAAEAFGSALDFLSNAVQNDQQLITALSTRQAETGKALTKLQQQLFAPHPQAAQVYAELSALDTLLDTLTPLTGMAPVTTDAPPADTSPSRWHRFLAIISNVWKHLVTIHHQRNTDLMLIPNAAQLLLMRMHGELSSARWALLHQEPLIYNTAIANVRHCLQQYFSPDDAKIALDRLASLDQIN